MNDKKIKEIAEQLLEPFDPMDIEWRIQKHGTQGSGKRWAMVLAYVTNRAIMERLDAVFGIGGWQNEYLPLSDGGFLCGIKALVPDAATGHQWVIKWDGADKTAVEATKGGISSAMKRAGVQWGIGRYLYRLETTFVELVEGRGDGSDITTSIKEGEKYTNVHFKRPALPKWALPKE